MLEALNLAAYFGAGFSILGAYLIAKGNRTGFWVFVVADFLLVGIQVWYRVWPQVGLLGAYFAMNVYGIVNSRRIAD